MVMMSRQPLTERTESLCNMFTARHRPMAFLVIFMIILCPILAYEACNESEDGTCESTSYSAPICGDAALCGAPPSSVYTQPGSGSAQAYKPDAPAKSTVCNVDGDTTRPYKIATWPLWNSRRTTPLKLNVTARLWSCPTSEHKRSSNECCCKPLALGKDDTKVEIWQTRPDGTYSSLIPGQEEGDCRATIHVHAGEHVFEFKTLAPGSTGAMGGLGPGGIDFVPYGPPVLHLLVSANHHHPLLVEVPIVTTPQSKQRSFWGSDYRGRAMSHRHQKNQERYQVASWNALPNTETLNLELDLFLHAGSMPASLEATLCPSILYGLPTSFFTEPISVCAPSLLDFFPL